VSQLDKRNKKAARSRTAPTMKWSWRGRSMIAKRLLKRSAAHGDAILCQPTDHGAVVGTEPDSVRYTWDERNAIQESGHGLVQIRGRLSPGYWRTSTLIASLTWKYLNETFNQSSRYVSSDSGLEDGVYAIIRGQRRYTLAGLFTHSALNTVPTCGSRCDTASTGPLYCIIAQSSITLLARHINAMSWGETGPGKILFRKLLSQTHEVPRLRSRSGLHCTARPTSCEAEPWMPCATLAREAMCH
jgi:hypothetical protein